MHLVDVTLPIVQKTPRNKKNMGATSENHKVDYDEILSHIGQFGPWQRRIHFLLWLASAASGLVVVVFSFTAFKADYRCR